MRTLPIIIALLVMALALIMSRIATALQSLRPINIPKRRRTATSKLSYSTMGDPPLDSMISTEPNDTKKSFTPPSFMDLMRKAALQTQASTAQQQQTVTTAQPKLRTKAKPLPSPSRRNHHVQEITTLSQFRTAIQSNNGNHRISVVRWHAAWCRACQMVEPAYHRMHERFPEVRYLDVPSSTKESGLLHAGFRIPCVPYGHIYHPRAGLVEELKLNPRTVRDFAAILQSYVDGECALAGDVDAATGVYAAPYRRIS